MTDELRAYERHLRGYLQHVAALYHVPGICLALSANGRRLELAVGEISTGTAPMPRNARFDIGRSARLLMSMVMLQLESQSKLNRQKPVAEYLPELRDTEFGNNVRVEHLLADTAGFRFKRAPDLEMLQKHSWEQVVASIQQGTVLFPPGSVFSQTLESQAVLGKIAATLGSSTVADAMRNILQRHRKANQGNAISHVIDPSNGKALPVPPFPLSQFWQSVLPDIRASAMEFLCLLEEIIEARDAADGASLVKPVVAATLQTQTNSVPMLGGGKFSEPPPISVGVGCPAFVPQWVGLNGPQFGQTFFFRYHAKSRVAFVCGANAGVPALSGVIAQEIQKSLGASPLEQTPHEADPPLTSDELAGQYIGTSGPDVDVRRIGTEILVETRGPQAHAIQMAAARGAWAPKTESEMIAAGCFRDQVGTPCLMLGSIAYRKSA